MRAIDKRLAVVAVTGALAPMVVSAAAAQSRPVVEPGTERFETSVLGGAFSGSDGLIAVNVVAGEQNLQSNAAAMVFTPGVPAAIGILTDQRLRATPSGPRSDSTAEIRAGAFQNVNGVVMVNLTSGDDNRVSNTTSIGIGAEVTVTAFTVGGALGDAAGLIPDTTGTIVDDSELSDASSVARTPSEGAFNSGQASVRVAGTAFANVSGVVQAISAAGSGNALANNVALAVGAGVQR